MVKIKRIYEPASSDDGLRILVDRLWPRGISKDKALIDLWLKEIAPSTGLRKWFDHDPKRWRIFVERYKKELKKNSTTVHDLKEMADKYADITLLYAARDTEHNEAIVIADLLMKQSLIWE